MIMVFFEEGRHTRPGIHLESTSYWWFVCLRHAAVRIITHYRLSKNEALSLMKCF